MRPEAPQSIESRVVHQDGLPTPQRYWSMLAIAIGIFMAVLDSAVANIALPTIARELGVTPAQSVWVINAYQLVIVISLLPLAALGERIGYRRVFLAGLVVFTAGSLACALSHSLPVLVLARVGQGIGASGLMAVNGALVRFTYPQSLLGRGVGLNAFVVSLSAAVGPTIASAILAVASWEWLFAVNVPIGLVNVAVAWRALPRSDLSQRRFDWVSAGLNAAAFGFLFLAVDMLAHGRGDLASGGLELAAALAAGLLLFRRESRVDRPLIPIDLLKIPIFALSVAASICSFAAYMLAFLGLPFYFESVLHRDQVQTGLLMTPWPVMLGLAAPIAGRLSDRLPGAVMGSAGLIVLAAGLLLLAELPAEASTADIAWRMAMCGLGFGFFQAPNNRTMLSSAPRQRAGAAGGMLATARLLGLTTGATLAAIAFRFAPEGAVRIDLFVGVAFATIAATVSLLRLKPSKAKPTVPAAS